MKETEICEMPEFDYTTKSFNKLKAELKTGKIVRNSFAKFYNDNIQVNIMQDKVKAKKEKELV